jgi:hypothetical protein
MIQAGSFLLLDMTHFPKTSIENYFVVLHVDFAAPQSDKTL